MLRTTPGLCAGFLLAALPLFCATAQAEIKIVHQPADEYPAGKRITLQADVEDLETGIDLVRAYFRTVDGGDYVFVDMVEEEADAYIGTLPAPARDAGTLEYFLLVENGTGQVVKSQNYFAAVTTGEASAAAASPARQVILQPSEFAAVEGYHGKLVKLVGDVQVIGEDGSARPAADAGFVVREAETLRTGTDGRVVVDFDGDPVTVLEEASRLNVKTPSWLTHLAGTAYFAFKRLLDAGQQQHTVASTVALIGIRGTTLMSYAALGVALKDGGLAIGSPDGQALEVTRNGTTETTRTFALRAGRFARFDGPRVTDSPMNAANRADIARAEAFLGPAGGRDNVTVTAEASPIPSRVSGFDDDILLVQAPRAAWLGLGAAGTTVVAGAGGMSRTTAIALGAVGIGALIAASGDSGGGSSGSSPTDPDPKTDPGSGIGSDFVGITANYEFIAPGGPAACLRVTDPCGNTFDSSTGAVSCGVGVSSFFVDPPSGTEQVSWSPAPPGTYLFDVVYCGSNPQGAPLSYSADILVSPNPAQNLTTRALNDIGDFQSFSFSVP